tara:strand:+ start:117 stop:788 length:672 start_codon:yes stop_codon:yes gene_type:complete
VSADFDKFLKLEKRLFKLIDDPLSEGPTTSRKIMGKKERIRNKMRKLESKIKGMKDGGSVRPIIKVDKDGRIRQTGKKRFKDGTIAVQPEGGIKFIPNKKDGGLMEAIEKVKAKEMKDGGNVPKPKMRPKKDPFRADKTVIINEDFSKAVAKANEEAMKKAKKMEEGGPVPAKFKGFSKLPEAVQEKMNPTLAKKFGEGGSVKGKMMCRGRGAAIKGGGFSIR